MTQLFSRYRHLEVIRPLAVILSIILHVGSISSCLNNSLYNVIAECEIKPIFQHKHTASTPVFIIPYWVDSCCSLFYVCTIWNERDVLIQTPFARRISKFPQLFYKTNEQFGTKSFSVHPLTHTHSIFWSVNFSICFILSNCFRPFPKCTVRRIVLHVRSIVE